MLSPRSSIESVYDFDLPQHSGSLVQLKNDDIIFITLGYWGDSIGGESNVVVIFLELIMAEWHLFGCTVLNKKSDAACRGISFC